MKKVAIVTALAGLLLFTGTAMAAEKTKNDDHSGHGTTQEQTNTKQESLKTTLPAQTPTTSDAQSHNMTTEEHQNMNMSTDGNQEMNMSKEEHQNMGSTGDSHNETNGTLEESESGGHGGHENVVETPPNIPVLSTFGAINAAFILFGVWNKWFRKKEGVLA